MRGFPQWRWYLDEVFVKIKRQALLSLERGLLVSLRLNRHIEDLALGVDGLPEVDHSAVDFQIDLVQMPRGMGLRATLSQVGRDHRSEMVHPRPNGLGGRPSDGCKRHNIVHAGLSALRNALKVSRRRCRVA